MTPADLATLLADALARQLLAHGVTMERDALRAVVNNVAMAIAYELEAEREGSTLEALRDI